jgi:tetratricopeptide (TPR) repeat protein
MTHQQSKLEKLYELGIKKFKSGEFNSEDTFLKFYRDNALILLNSNSVKSQKDLEIFIFFARHNLTVLKESMGYDKLIENLENIISEISTLENRYNFEPIKDDFLDMQFTLGKAYFEIEKYENAQVIFGRLSSIDPKNEEYIIWSLSIKNKKQKVKIMSNEILGFIYIVLLFVFDNTLEYFKMKPFFILIVIILLIIILVKRYQTTRIYSTSQFQDYLNKINL